MQEYDERYQKKKKTLVTVISSILVMVLLILIFSLFMTGRAKETRTTNPRPPVQKSTKKNNDQDNENVVQNVINTTNTTNTTSEPENVTEDTNTIGNEVDNTVVQNPENVVNTTVDPNSNTTTNPDTNTVVDISGLIPRDKNKVSVDIKPNSLTVTGVTLVISDTNANLYKWVPDAKVQRYTAEDGWKDLIEVNPQEEQEMKVYDLYPYEEKIDWTTRYGTLGPGSYRVVKTGESGEYYFEFNVAGGEEEQQ